MRASKLYAPTLRETPAEAEIVSHQLMLRAGMLHKVAAGIYTYMPLAWRVMQKVMAIIREEMDAIGGQELLMPIVHPAEMWQQSGRWQVYGDELWRVNDRHGREFCLGPTNEEVITLTIKNDVRSYKQLPLRPYQMQSKFRDERRPRFGLMRGREFIMKDMYSFDRDEEGLDESYRLAHLAYSNIFRRLGLDFRVVEADSGAIGGKGSHQFMALAQTGEEEILYCDACDYAASAEIASVPPRESAPAEQEELALVHTPDCTTIEQVSAFLNVPAHKIVKALCYQADGQLVLVLLAGHRQINEIKLKNALNCLDLAFASDEAMRKAGLVPGYLGAAGLKDVRVLADREVPFMNNHVMGGGQEAYHYIGANPGRDYRIDAVEDLRMAEAGEPCPRCGAPLRSARGIEVGQIFKLRTKYSKALGARYIDEKGQEQDIVMGCYGIGVGRSMAAVIEQSHDENGIIWPLAVAPYQVVIVPVNDRDAELTSLAESLYQELLAQKVEAVLDDRPERPGVKFNDADLIGYP
ncbi:MAG: proline--tRNA ligase, partial [Clostridiales bacterium]|nr:proline--tRNA ligase [Clostridiales bacterium]